MVWILSAVYILIAILTGIIHYQIADKKFNATMILSGLIWPVYFITTVFFMIKTYINL